MAIKWATSIPKPSKVIRAEIDHWQMVYRICTNEMDTLEEFFNPLHGRYGELWTKNWKKRNHASLMSQTLHVDLSAAERREAIEMK
ncbi:hypothetical protein [Cohnella sp.]|uniref:hypothetical protein n=1 Tax=Cohnella sp. TaxID=1883426 RepID=UPI00370469E8